MIYVTLECINCGNKIPHQLGSILTKECNECPGKTFKAIEVDGVD